MRCLVAFLMVSIANSAPAQEDLRALDPGSAPAPGQMLHAFLLKEAQKLFDARRKTVAAIKTPTDLERRQKELKARFLAALGGFPEKAPLNARVVGQLRGDGFHVEKVIYESRPSHHVTALLYLPEGKGPFPGVLVPCGHSVNGKAADLYQRACILMAKNGLAVLCYDPIGQGERVQILDSSGKPALAGSTTEHTMVGVGALLVGRCTASYRIWDGIRSLDYLASRPEVDAKRLGCTGNSGGGTMTAYLMALDDRIVAAAPSCYLTSLERLFATIGPQDAEQNIPGQVAFGMEHADYLTMRAPRPTLLCVAKYDFFDEAGAWASFREATGLYGLLEHGERIALFEYPDKHGFSKPRRQAAMRWMRRWLLKKDDAPVEIEGPLFSDKELQCTKTGQVLIDFSDKSVVDFNAKAARELAAQRGRKNAKLPAGELRDEVRRLLALPKPGKVRVTPSAQAGSRVTKLTFETEPGIRIPGLLFTPAKASRFTRVTIYLDGAGMAAAARPHGPVEKLVAAGKPVLTLDLRGMGETAPTDRRGESVKYFGPDWREAFLAQHLSRPLLGQRVHDLLAVVNHLHINGKTDLHVVAVGTAAPAALHAAALEPRIKSLTVDRCIVSWSAVATATINMDQLTNIVPGALAVYDLPELAGLVAPRQLTIRAAVDPLLRPVTQKVLEDAYAPCRSAFERQKAAHQLVLQAVP
jgi:cephalosporin-C deacetylase-like acetyl esterase